MQNQRGQEWRALEQLAFSTLLLGWANPVEANYRTPPHPKGMGSSNAEKNS